MILSKNKGADQTERMRRLVCACVVLIPPKTGLITPRPISKHVLDLPCNYKGEPLSDSGINMACKMHSDNSSDHVLLMLGII